jgi:glucuronosyltransferase
MEMIPSAIFVFLSIVLFQKDLASVSGYRILVLSPITSPSHTNFFKPVVRELAERGHQVTYWNGLKTSNDVRNNKTNLEILYSHEMERFNSDHNMRFDDQNAMLTLLTFPRRAEFYCKILVQDPIYHQLRNSIKRYDLIIMESFFNECALPLVRKFGVPFVYMMGLAPSPWLLDALGSSIAFDHVPHSGSNYRNEMNLWQRTYNTFSWMVILYFYRFFVMPAFERHSFEVLKLENQSFVMETEREYLSLAIVNTHFSINYQYPTSPAVIQAGGLQCVPPKSLPRDLESFVDGSGDAGFIIVSFGSILRGADVSDNIRRLFLSTFTQLPQKILWKWENEMEHKNDSSSIPSNVKLLPWMPQQDLLGHPKIRLFITHGGIFSNQEAVYHGVPLIVLPVYSDQPVNAQKAQDDGYGIRLDWGDLNEEILLNAIQTILSNSRYEIFLFSPTYN